MKRERMLMAPGIAQRLDMDHTVIRQFLHLFHDKGWAAEAENGCWRAMHAGHDYPGGSSEQSISLKSLG